jgi:hypothetical protein
MMIYFKMVAQEYPQDRMTDDGSGEPIITAHYKTLYYLIIYSVYDAALQVYRIVHNLLLFSLLCFHPQEPAE